jgi:cell division protein FtsW
MSESESRTLGSPDWILLGATTALAAVGLLMVYSSTADISYRAYSTTDHYFKRQLLFMGIGLVAMIGLSFFPHRHWTKFSIPIMALTLIMLLALVLLDRGRLLIGKSVSPVELAKLAVVIYIGHWLSTKGELLRRLPYGLLPFTIMVGIIAGLVVAQPDVSEAVVIVLVAVAMFFLAGADVIQFLIGIAGGIVAFALVVHRLDVAMARLEPFLRDWRDPLNSSNFQLRQGIISLGSGGLLGQGPGNGRMKYLWLPAAHTDSIFAFTGEELGLAGCLAIIGLFALLTYRGLRIAQRAPDHFGGLLATGITCWIAFQAFVNIAAVTGTIPFTGIALPFISVGGSSLVTCLIGIGILLSISRSANLLHSNNERAIA